MKLNSFLFLLLVLCYLQPVRAQVDPPVLQCISNDTLIWVNTPISCGPFLGTQVFSATDPNGPFTQIANITDANEDRLFDPNPGGQLRFYYLQYRFDCPGNPVQTSDTLDNRIPLPPASTWVSVEDNTVVVHWTESGSPQTSGYLIYREELTGTTVIGQVNSPQTTTYTDNSFMDVPPSSTYRVTAIDACGNSSLFGPEVTTPDFTSSGGSGCTSVISLMANAAAASSPLPFLAWELFASVDGAPFVSAGMFGPSAMGFVYDQANDGENICFYAEGMVQGQSSRPVRTPVQCIDVVITQPVRVFDLFGAGFDPLGNLTYDFGWDPNAAVSSLELNIVDGAGVAATEGLMFNSLMGPEAMNTTVATALPEGSFSLSLRAEDICENLVITNTVNPVFLMGTSTVSGTNTLSWTRFDNELATDITYDLIRTAQDGTQTTLTSGTEITFMDVVGTSDPDLALACYRVDARVNFPDGSQRIYSSRTVCLEQEPMVYLPNVFSPSATMIDNREFCPGFSRQPTGNYRLDIYDRWGGHRFSSTDPTRCWDGMSRDRPAASGVYLYVLELEIGGRTLKKTGDITLLR